MVQKKRSRSKAPKKPRSKTPKKRSRSKTPKRPRSRTPKNVSFKDAYDAIRSWYSTRVARWMETYTGGFAGPPPTFTHTVGLIRALPSSAQVSDLECRAVFAEVINGFLEFGSQETDGRLKMAEYAKAALETAGVADTLTSEEREELRVSPLWPYFRFNRPDIPPMRHE